MKKQVKAYLREVLVAMLLAVAFPVQAASVACSHQPVSMPCDCCSVPSQPAPCAAPCQLEAPGPVQAAIAKSGDRQAKPVEGNETETVLLFQRRLARLPEVLFIAQAAATTVNPPPLYLQSHNLRL